MSILDITNDDAFSLSSLTASIQDQPYVPGRLGQLGLFGAEGVTTTTIQVEKKGNTLSLVPAGVRGQRGNIAARDKRDMIPFNLIHLPQSDGVTADEAQNLRAFGTEASSESVPGLIQQRLATMRQNIDATLEHHRIGAVKGVILDADGSTVLEDVNSRFSITQDTMDIQLSSTTAKMQGRVLEILNQLEDNLGGLAFQNVRVLCGRNFFNALVENSKLRESYARWQEGAQLRNDPRAGFEFGGVTWEQYRGSVGGVKFIADDEAFVVPEGVPGMFITRFGPADYNETVNTLGQPYYARMETRGMGKGYDLEAQSNVICLNTRPQGVIKLTHS